MAVCGCGSVCGCLIDGSDGILVTGSGTTANPIRISTDLNTPLGCKRGMACVTARLNPGLKANADKTRITVSVSTSPGNDLESRSDGLWSPVCSPSCTRRLYSVDDLPTSGIVIGDEGVGYYSNPTNTRQMLALGHALSDRVVFALNCVELADGTWWMTPLSAEDPPYATFTWNEGVKNHVAGPGNALNLTPYAPLDRPFPARYCGAPETLAISAYEVLKKLGGEAIIQVTWKGSTEEAFNRFVDGPLEMVRRLGLQKSVIYRDYYSAMEPFRYEMLKLWASYGGFSMLHLTSKQGAAAHPPAQLIADGIKWVGLQIEYPQGSSDPNNLEAADILPYSSQPELRCIGEMLSGAGYQGATAQAAILGLQGLGDVSDALYTPGLYNGYEYRITHSPWQSGRQGWGEHFVGSPALSTSGSIECLYASYTTESGLPLAPTTDVWKQVTLEPPRAAPGDYNQLLGWAVPLATPSSFTLNGIMRHGLPQAGNGSAYIGIVFNVARDDLFTTDGPWALGNAAFALRITRTGQLQLWRFGPGTSLPTLLGTQNGLSPAADMAVQIVVTPTQISVRAGTPTPTLLITVSDSNPRQPYMYLHAGVNSSSNTVKMMARSFTIT